MNTYSLWQLVKNFRSCLSESAVIKMQLSHMKKAEMRITMFLAWWHSTVVSCWTLFLDTTVFFKRWSNEVRAQRHDAFPFMFWDINTVHMQNLWQLHCFVLLQPFLKPQCFYGGFLLIYCLKCKSYGLKSGMQCNRYKPYLSLGQKQHLKPQTIQSCEQWVWLSSQDQISG